MRAALRNLIRNKIFSEGMESQKEKINYAND